MQARRIARIASLVLMAALFAVGSQLGAAGMFRAPWDKFAHLGYFMAMTLLLLKALPGRAWLCVGIALLVGAADELYQMRLPGRESGVDDWLADAAGAALALLLYRAIGVRVTASRSNRARSSSRASTRRPRTPG